MIKIGDKISLTQNLQGVVKFIGEIKDKEGIWVGLELNKPKGKNNGIINNIEYFRCENNFGVFFRKQHLMDKIQKIKNTNLNINDIDNKNYVENEEEDYKKTIQHIIDKNTYLSKIIDMKKKYADLQDTNTKKINLLNNEIKVLKDENKRLQDENMVIKKLNGNFLKNKNLSLKIKDFIKDAEDIIQEMLTILNNLEQNNLLKNNDVLVKDEKEFLNICDIFKSVIFSVMENDSDEFNSNVERYKNKIKNLKNNDNL